jgi:hypothetical protein
MRTQPLLPLFAMLLLLPSCGLYYTDIEEHPCPPGGTTLTYTNFGASFINGYCESCHGSQAVDRAGAPGEFIFDTVDQVQRHRVRIFARSAADNDSMPPGPDDPPEAEREQLADWLACGAPP